MIESLSKNILKGTIFCQENIQFRLFSVMILLGNIGHIL